MGGKDASERDRGRTARQGDSSVRAANGLAWLLVLVLLPIVAPASAVAAAPAGGWVSAAVVRGTPPGSTASGTHRWTPLTFAVTAGPLDAHIRSAPTTSSAIIGRLPAHSRLTCSGWQHGQYVVSMWSGKPDARWYRIAARPAPARASARGWVSAAVVRGSPPGSTTSGTHLWTPSTFTVTAGSLDVHIRSAPTTSSAIIGRLPAHSRLTCCGWQHGQYVVSMWSGKPDARWYRFSGGSYPGLRLPGHPEVIAIARHYLGVRYRYGGAGPTSGFDCSGLVKYCYAKIGIRLEHYSGAQQYEGLAVLMDRLVPGDLVFMGYPVSHHVALYAGGGQVIQAPHTGAVVSYRSLAGFQYAVRIP
jgi:cell wall-associated NlpC family hydrolase